MTNLSRIIPAPRALFVFEAAARHGSFTAAATEFNVTQPSVSRCISQFEDDLGFKLFERHSRGLVLTPEGNVLFKSVQEGLTSVSNTIHTLRNSKKKLCLTMSLSSSFATHWLLPRLGEFNEAFPDIDLRFELVAGVMKEVTGDVDIATRIVEDNDPRYEIWDFAPEIIVPVCSPQYLDRHGRLDDASRLAQQTFLHLTDHQKDQWKPFLGASYPEISSGGTWNQFSDYAVILQAASQGRGVALGWISVIADALRQGVLTRASAVQVDTGRIHRLIIPKNRVIPSLTRKICEWLQSRMANDLDLLAIRTGASMQRSAHD
jgi:DNA-binding transcriptional LysR family regulator